MTTHSWFEVVRYWSQKRQDVSFGLVESGLNEYSDKFVNWDCQNDGCDTILVMVKINEIAHLMKAKDSGLTQR